MPRLSAPIAAPCLRGLRGRLPAAELVAERAGRIVGLRMGRDGALAAQIGPLIAEDETIAAALLARALEGIEGPLFVDLADSKQELRSLPRTRGFTAVRPFTRMLYGSSTRFDDAARTFAVIGPEFGWITDCVPAHLRTLRPARPTRDRYKRREAINTASAG